MCDINIKIVYKPLLSKSKLTFDVSTEGKILCVGCGGGGTDNGSGSMCGVCNARFEGGIIAKAVDVALVSPAMAI